LQALLNNTSGNANVALGYAAGSNLTTGNNNIDIGALGLAGESNTIRIGKAGTQNATYIQGIFGATVASAVQVMVDSNGQLGTLVSSARFKEAIKPMNEASESLLALRPVTFHYKHDMDPGGIPQFGLIAEEVEKVNPALVVRDADGKLNTVRYEAVNAMLLNEFLKEHRKVEQLEAIVFQQQKAAESTAAQLHNEISGLTASLKEQASQIEKVSAQLALIKPGAQVATITSE
jgi:predicted ribosome quality control (RQC) complex YloA/Tae2 family protein